MRPSSHAFLQISRGNSPVWSWCAALGTISFSANSRASVRSCCCSSVRAKSTMRPPRGADKGTPPRGAVRPAAIDPLLLLLPHLLLPFPAARIHLLRRHLLGVSGDAPVMTERIDDLAEAIPPEHVGDGHRQLRPRVHRLLDDGVDVRDVQEDRPGDAPRRLW